MSITDELREGGIYRPSTNTRVFFEEELLEIADRIDEQHRRDMATAQQVGYNDGEDAAMRDGWVKLPVDADGVPIRIGDEVTCGATVWTVTGLKFLGYGWGICCTVCNEYGGSSTSVYPPSDMRHHHTPTVEDVLREFAEKITDSQIPNVHPTYEEAIAEYAARLRLAGDGE